jgi:hypothetical protein
VESEYEGLQYVGYDVCGYGVGVGETEGMGLVGSGAG